MGGLHKDGVQTPTPFIPLPRHSAANSRNAVLAGGGGDVLN